MSLHTPVLLLTLPSSLWQPNVSSPWPALLEAQAMHGRRLAKGIELREVRLALLEFARRLNQAVQTTPVEERWTVPADLLPAWHAALERLADRRARRASQHTGRRSMPKFLPCVFGPGRNGDLHAGAYGPLTVAAHLDELSRLIDNNPEADGVDARLRQAFAARRVQFARAAQVDAGLVEWIAPEP